MRPNNLLNIIEEKFEERIFPFIFKLLIAAGLVLPLLWMATAQADSRYRPPPKPERGDIEQIQNQGQNQSQSQDQAVTVEAGASASQDQANAQSVSISHRERAFRTILSTTNADADNGSTAPCLESRRSIAVGPVGVGGRTRLNEKCWAEYERDKEHAREMARIQSVIELVKAVDRLEGPLGRQVLCTELGLSSAACPMVPRGGDKGSEDNDEYVEQLEQEVSNLRERNVHGDILK